MTGYIVLAVDSDCERTPSYRRSVSPQSLLESLTAIQTIKKRKDIDYMVWLFISVAPTNPAIVRLTRRRLLKQLKWLFDCSVGQILHRKIKINQIIGRNFITGYDEGPQLLTNTDNRLRLITRSLPRESESGHRITHWIFFAVWWTAAPGPGFRSCQ